MPLPGRSFPYEVALAHDVVAYHRDATAGLYEDGRPERPRPLAAYPPGHLVVTGDPLELCPRRPALHGRPAGRGPPRPVLGLGVGQLAQAGQPPHPGAATAAPARDRRPRGGARAGGFGRGRRTVSARFVVREQAGAWWLATVPGEAPPGRPDRGPDGDESGRGPMNGLDPVGPVVPPVPRPPRAPLPPLAATDLVAPVWSWVGRMSAGGVRGRGRRRPRPDGSTATPSACSTPSTGP